MVNDKMDGRTTKGFCPTLARFVILVATTSLVSTTLLCSLNVFGQGIPHDSVVVDSILTSEAASLASHRYTGFLGDRELSPTASSSAEVEAIVMEDSTTPFVSLEINGKSAWHIEYSPFILHLDSARERLAHMRPKKASVYLGSPGGKFFTAIITDAVTDLDLDRRPTSEEAEHLLSVLGEKYWGLPDSPPSVDLLTALKQCKGYPVGAKEIVVSYVMYSFKEWEPFPAWIIYMRGLPPWTASNLAPDYARTNMRCVVNARTGEFFLRNNVPYPQLGRDTVELVGD